MIYGSWGRSGAHVERRALSSLLIRAARPALLPGALGATAPAHSSTGLESSQALQKLTS